MAEGSGPKVVFGFSKKVKASNVVQTKFRNDPADDEGDDSDLVVGFEGGEFQSKVPKAKKKEPEPLVIPLIRENVWRGANRNQQSASEKDSVIALNGSSSGKLSSADEKLDLESQARKELRQNGEEFENSEVQEDIVIKPLLLQNAIPAGFEKDENMDVSLRPDSSTLDDYEKVPVEQYGLAVLRGMGWSKDTGIGRTNKGHIEMKEPSLRPKGLGLGAERPTANKDAVQSKDGGREEKLVFKIGAYAMINKGPNKGMYCQITGFDEDNNRVAVKLAINSKMADISKFNIDIVSASDYKTKSKVINNEKYEQYKAKVDEAGGFTGNSYGKNRSRSLSSSRSRSRSPARRQENSSHRSARRDDYSRSRDEGKSNKHQSSSPERRKHKKKSKDKKKHKKRHRRSSSSSRSRSPIERRNRDGDRDREHRGSRR